MPPSNDAHPSQTSAHYAESSLSGVTSGPVSEAASGAGKGLLLLSSAAAISAGANAANTLTSTAVAVTPILTPTVPATCGNLRGWCGADDMPLIPPHVSINVAAGVVYKEPTGSTVDRTFAGFSAVQLSSPTQPKKDRASAALPGTAHAPTPVEVVSSQQKQKYPRGGSIDGTAIDTSVAALNDRNPRHQFSGKHVSSAIIKLFAFIQLFHDRKDPSWNYKCGAC